MTTLTNARGYKHVTHRDDAGRPIAVDDASIASTRYEYGPFSIPRRDRVAGPLAQPGNLEASTTTTTDAYGRVLWASDPSHGDGKFEYDGFDEVTHQIDGNGKDIFYKYDKLGRLIRRTDADGVTSWKWDSGKHARGKLIETVSPDLVITRYRYDELGRLHRQELEVEGVTLTFTIDYDTHGRLERLTYPSSDVAVFEYDEHSNLVRVRPGQGGTPWWSLEEADASGRIVQERLGNGVWTRRTHDPLNGLLRRIDSYQASGQPIQALRYSYDKARNVTRREDQLGHQYDAFDYDPLDRLIKATIRKELPGGATAGGPAFDELVQGYDYDVLGNLKSKGGVGSYGYDPQRPYQIKSVGGGKYAHDDAGNLKVRPEGPISYTAFNKPRSITTNGKKVSYLYDASGQRVAKCTGSEVTYYAFGSYELTMSSHGVRHERAMIRSPERVVAVLVRDRTSGPVDPRGADSSYLLVDRSGSLDVVTDASGKVIERRSYDAFGARRNPQNWTKPALGGGGLNVQSFTGHEEDPEAGLIDMGGRLYDPRLGRFLSADPFVPSPSFSQAFNRYAYVFNNPVTLIDPSGFAPEDCLSGETICGGPTPNTGGLTIEVGGLVNRVLGGGSHSVGGGGSSIGFGSSGTPSGALGAAAPTSDRAPTGSPSPVAASGEFDLEMAFLKHGDSIAYVVGGASVVVGGAAVGIVLAEAGLVAGIGAGVSAAGRWVLGGGLRLSLPHLGELAVDALGAEAGVMPGALGPRLALAGAGARAVENSGGGRGLLQAAKGLLSFAEAAEATPGAGGAGTRQMTTAIGRMKDLERFGGDPAFDTWAKSGRIPGPGEPPVTWAENARWLQERVTRGDKFVIATDPTTLPPVKGGYIRGVPNGYFTARELAFLRALGIEPTYLP